MKTRIFTIAAMLILSTQLIAGKTNLNVKDSTMIIAWISSGKNSFVFNTGNISVSPGINSTVNANVLEEWISTRETWEQDGYEHNTGNFLTETVNLEEWVSGREMWERESEVYKTETGKTVSLEEWIATRETWEQKE